jgi:methionyl-tRNA formyltransferase
MNSAHEVVAVVTTPDKPKGRGMKVQTSPVKAAALEAGLPVLQPPTLRSPEVQESLAALGADVFVVVAYGLILPTEVLAIPPLGCVNVHFSLLPLFRGAAPVQWAILEGHRTTGVAIMKMDPGLDTGPVLRMVEEPVEPEDDAGSLADRLSHLGAKVLVEVLDRLEEIEPVPQPDSGSSYASKLSNDDARIDWSLPAASINNRIRAFSPRPGAWSLLNGKRLKILRARVLDGTGSDPGTLAITPEGGLRIDAGTGSLELEEVQPEGRSRMTAQEFVRGHRTKLGGRLI